MQDLISRRPAMYSRAMADIIEYTPSSAMEVGRRLRRGEVGIIPCDTIYGLCAHADSRNAERLYEIKKRPASKSFITLMTKEQISERGLDVPEDILSIWPAPLTAVLPDGEGGTIAVRVPDDGYLLSLLPVSGPIFSTSVNLSGESSLLTYDEIIPVFGESVDFIVRDIEAGGSVASTLIDATVKPYKVIRQGACII